MVDDGCRQRPPKKIAWLCKISRRSTWADENNFYFQKTRAHSKCPYNRRIFKNPGLPNRNPKTKPPRCSPNRQQHITSNSTPGHKLIRHPQLRNKIGIPLKAYSNNRIRQTRNAREWIIPHFIKIIKNKGRWVQIETKVIEL